MEEEESLLKGGEVLKLPEVPGAKPCATKPKVPLKKYQVFLDKFRTSENSEEMEIPKPNTEFELTEYNINLSAKIRSL